MYVTNYIVSLSQVGKGLVCLENQHSKCWRLLELDIDIVKQLSNNYSQQIVSHRSCYSIRFVNIQGKWEGVKLRLVLASYFSNLRDAKHSCNSARFESTNQSVKTKMILAPFFA